jgi:hypothetical protein
MPMREITANAALVAKCGLYCGACKAYLKERCPGCAGATSRGWCPVRACCLERGYASCADCAEFPDPRQCRKFYSAMARLFSFVFRSDRPACIAAIKAAGYDGYAADMAKARRQSIKRGRG